MRFGLPDVAEPPADLSLLLAEFPQAFFKFRALSLGAVFVPIFILAENATHAGFERAAFLKSAAKQIDTERTQLVGHKPFKYLKRARSFRRDQRSLSRGKQMTNQIGDGMRFSCARRSLHKYAACRSNLVHNAALLIVRWFGEEDLTIENSVCLFRLIATIFRSNFRKVREFAGDDFAVLDLLLDPFQGLGKALGGALTQDQGGSIFHDGLR